MNNKDLEARKNKYFYMYDGLKVIKPELRDEWIEYVDNHIHDQIDGHIIELSILLLKNLMNGTSYEIIEKALLELDSSNEMINQIVAIVIKFSSQGAEFKKYWNSKNSDNKIIEINSSCKRI